MERFGSYRSNAEKTMNNEYLTFLGYSPLDDLRWRATSGGVCSGIIKYMLDTEKARTALSFTFNQETLRYEPQLIHGSSDYLIASSIYHEVKIIDYVKLHIQEIQEPFVCTALPCQVRPLKVILSQNHIEHYIISLVCSSQQSFAATEYLLSRLGLQVSEVKRIQYRGNGWPSGIQIETMEGKTIHIPNLDSVWTRIFHSRLFCMDRCFFCNPHMTNPADMMIADPWRIKEVRTDRKGYSLISVSSSFKEDTLVPMIQSRKLVLESVKQDIFPYSQEGVILLKERYLRHKRTVRAIKAVYKNKIYRNIVLSCPVMFSAHCFFKKVIEKLFIR